MDGDQRDHQDTAGQDPYRTFRPRFGLVVSWATTTVILGGCVVLAVVTTGPLASVGNRISLVLFGLLCALLLWRLGGVHADPSPTGLVVRNVVYTRRLDWAEILSVDYGSGDPWVRLDLTDGKTLAVMGIQRADGERGDQEARRLAALVQAHGEAMDR
ncbi:PH domain-containing protein [Oerskovia flava]|uniref:PH domain-containing protein n=1 Tax=Oerskovia flava TaxID=2986422 RepID=UPI0022402328|nr:PH domain-containing protein [Oerskovia sp. JB1-3-2]